MCRTLNSDIVTQSNALSNQLSTHDAGIKSLLNNRGCVKSVQVVNSGNITAYNGNGEFSFNISAVNMEKTILLTDSISNTDLGSFEVIATLTSNTSISVSIVGTSYDSSSHIGGSFTGIVNIQVIEFY